MKIDFPPVNVTIQGMENVRLPKMYAVKQVFDASRVENPPETLARAVKALNPERFRGKRLCITAGSRGIPGMPALYRAVCQVLKQAGAKPFIVPAMGSHGGATAQGQLDFLAGYGVTEESVGAPILSSMDVIEYGRLDNGLPLYCDKLASQSDGIVLMHKVKPHTDYRGEHESGLCKMIAIGLGKHKGASAFHTLGFECFAERVPQTAEIFLERLPVAFGVGLVQNAYDDVCAIEAVEPGEIMEMDARLLRMAKEKIARFKCRQMDVLVLDQIGKEISGFGFDPNIVGRTNGIAKDFEGILDLKKFVILGLTEKSHHNGSGIAAADLTTRDCLNDIDWSSTWTNLITSTRIKGASIPLYMNNDLEAIMLAIRTCAGIDYDRVRLARARNTLCTYEIEVSEALFEEMRLRSDVEVIGGPYPMDFDEKGRIAPLRV